VRTRSAVPENAETIVCIYHQGTEVSIATFETRLRSAEDIRSWFGGAHPIVVVEGNEIAAFADTSNYRPRECYAGVAEFSVYTARGARSLGAVGLAMGALIEAAERAGFWKLVSRVFRRERAEPKAALLSRFPGGWGLRETRPARRRVAGRGDRRTRIGAGA
jgi:L-amino acid N-acyltransferase YncA